MKKYLVLSCPMKVLEFIYSNSITVPKWRPTFSDTYYLIRNFNLIFGFKQPKLRTTWGTAHHIIWNDCSRISYNYPLNYYEFLGRQKNMALSCPMKVIEFLLEQQTTVFMGLKLLKSSLWVTFWADIWIIWSPSKPKKFHVDVRSLYQSGARRVASSYFFIRNFRLITGFYGPKWRPICGSAHHRI